MFQYIKSSIANIMTSKLRSALTLLGVLVGTASVVALISSGQLATETALAQFKKLGTDLLSVSVQSQQTKNQNGNENDLTHSQAEQLINASPQIVQVAPYTLGFGQISYAGNNIPGSLIGASQTFADINKIRLEQGRFVSHLDKEAFYCVIGSNITKKLRSQGLFNPLGKQLRIGGNIFTIIGVAKVVPENLFIFADINNSIIIPLATSLQLNKYVKIRDIIVKLTPGADIGQAETSIKNYINTLVSNKRLFFRSAKELVASMKKQRQTFTIMLGAIGAISLIVGGIGVMNIMLVSVMERRREIGIRMAVGAKHRHIRMMFLTEAIVLTVFGGALGVVFGILISLTIAEFSHWTFHIFLFPPVIGFLVSALVGIFFGFYPAYKASKLQPIEALRTE